MFGAKEGFFVGPAHRVRPIFSVSFEARLWSVELTSSWKEQFLLVWHYHEIERCCSGHLFCLDKKSDFTFWHFGSYHPLPGFWKTQAIKKRENLENSFICDEASCWGLQRFKMVRRLCFLCVLLQQRCLASVTLWMEIALFTNCDWLCKENKPFHRWSKILLFWGLCPFL